MEEIFNNFPNLAPSRTINLFQQHATDNKETDFRTPINQTIKNQKGGEGGGFVN